MPAPTTRRRRRAAALVEARRRIFEVVPVDVLQWDATRPVPQPKPIAGAAVLRVPSGKALRWRELIPRERQRRVDRFLARGDEGYLATIDGRFAGWIWVSRTSHRDPWSGLQISLAPDEAYTYAMWIDAAHRRDGLAAFMVASMLSALRGDATVSKVYGWVDARNRESQLLLRMVFGFSQVQRVKRAHLLRRVGWQVRGSDEPPYGPVSAVGRHSAAGSRRR